MADSVVGDFNRDGKMDFAVLDQTSVHVFINIPTSIPTAFRATYSVGFYSEGLTDADFNGDGVLDLAIVSQFGPSGGGDVTILLGNGDGTFRTGSRVASGQSDTLPSKTIASADFNRDGKIDLAVLGETDGVSVLFGRGDGTFGAPAKHAVPRSFMIVVSDVDHSGGPDLVVSSYSGVFCLLNDGKGNLSRVHGVTFSGAEQAKVGDFTGDGVDDLLVLEDDRTTIALFRGSATAVFPTAPATFTVAPAFQASNLMIGDMNGDGHLDLVIGYDATGFTLLAGTGDGNFSAPVSLGPSGLNLWAMPILGDFTGDGKVDVAACVKAIAGSASAAVSIFESNMSCSSSGGHYGVRLYNVDDHMTATLTNASNPNGRLVAHVDFGGDTGLVDITPFLTAGTNTLRIQCINDGGGYAYGYQVLRDQTEVAAAACGTANSVGCNNNDLLFGVVLNKEIDLSGSSSGCAYALDHSSASSVASGSSNQVVIHGTPSGCSGTWSGSSNAAWITISGGGTGSGAGPFTLTYSVQANAGPSRTGTMTIAGQTFTVSQAGTGTCTQDGKTACVLNGRFKVNVRYRSQFDDNSVDTDALRKVLNGFASTNFETVFFYFNSEANIELLLKILDQGNTDAQGHPTFAVLYGTATPLRIEITITDTLNGSIKRYVSAFPTMQGGADFTAFVK